MLMTRLRSKCIAVAVRAYSLQKVLVYQQQLGVHLPEVSITSLA